MARRQRVLIVEDDADLRQLYRQTLSMAGYDVMEARGGFEALRHLDSKLPDIVVLDLLLPGLDGRTVRDELAAQTLTSQIPIVVVTGSTEKLESLEVACILRKPFSPERLVEAVRTCLAAGPPRVS
jgi:DNA-binding response OmpR family regulator